MALKVPFDASLLFMDALVAQVLEGSFLCLYQNPVIISGLTSLLDILEADFDGYARIELTGWPASTLNPSNKASVALPMQIFECTGVSTPNDIYGAFVLFAAGDLLWIEENPTAPISVNSIGQKYGYLPRFTDKSEF